MSGIADVLSGFHTATGLVFWFLEWTDLSTRIWHHPLAPLLLLRLSPLAREEEAPSSSAENDASSFSLS